MKGAGNSKGETGAPDDACQDFNPKGLARQRGRRARRRLLLQLLPGDLIQLLAALLYLLAHLDDVFKVVLRLDG